MNYSSPPPDFSGGGRQNSGGFQGRSGGGGRGYQGNGGGGGGFQNSKWNNENWFKVQPTWKYKIIETDERNATLVTIKQGCLTLNDMRYA